MSKVKETILDEDLEGLQKLMDIISLTILNENQTTADRDLARKLFMESCGLSSSRSIKQGDETLDKYRENLIKKRRREQQQAEHEDFKFEIKVLTMEDIENDQKLADIKIDDKIINVSGMSLINISKEWMNMDEASKKVALNKKYVDRDSSTPSVAMQIANSQYQSSSAEQRDNLVFVDSEKTLVDWESTLANLKIYVVQNGYSEKMVKSALLNMIRSVNNSDGEFYSNMSANEIARHLIKSSMRVDKTLVYKAQLFKVERTPGQPLSYAMERVRRLLDKIHPGPENWKLKESKLLTALLSFTDDKISSDLGKEIKKRRDNNIELDIDNLQDLVMKLEVRENIYPNQNLRYGRKFTNDQKDTLDLMHTYPEVEDDEEAQRRRKKILQDQATSTPDKKQIRNYTNQPSAEYLVPIPTRPSRPRTPVLPEIVLNDSNTADGYEGILVSEKRFYKFDLKNFDNRDRITIMSSDRQPNTPNHVVDLIMGHDDTAITTVQDFSRFKDQYRGACTSHINELKDRELAKETSSIKKAILALTVNHQKVLPSTIQTVIMIGQGQDPNH